VETRADGRALENSFLQLREKTLLRAKE